MNQRQNCQIYKGKYFTTISFDFTIINYFFNKKNRIKHRRYKTGKINAANLILGVHCFEKFSTELELKK